MKRWMTAVMFLLFFLFSVQSSYAAHTIEIAVDSGNPPFMYEKDGKAEGIYPELIRAVFKKMGIPASVKPYPWKRALQMASKGKIGIGGIYKSAEREKIFDYSVPLFTEKLLVYVPRGRGFPFTGVHDLKGKVVGVLSGWSYGEDFDKARKDRLFKVEEVSSDDLNFRKLAMGRLDCCIAIELSGNIAMDATGTRAQVEVLDTPLSIKDTYLIFRKSTNRKALLDQFNAAVDAMRKDGSYNRIVNSFK